MQLRRSARSYLTASDVASFVYCPESWYLARFGTAPDPEATRRLRAGSLAHRRIGRSTDRLLTTDALRRGLLIAMILAALLLFVQLGATLAGLPR